MLDLSDVNIKLKHYQDGTQKTKCPQCQPPHKMSDDPLSVTIENNQSKAVWKCHHCDWTGYKFAENTNWYPQKKNSYTEYEKPVIHNKTYEDFIYSFLKKRGISITTAKDFKIFSDGDWIGFPYFDEKSEIANIKFRTVDKKFRQKANTRPLFYNYDNVRNKDMVFICEGEIDVLSLAECGFNNATTLANGAPKEAKFNKDDARFKALTESPLSATKIVLFTDNDSSGHALHKELLHRYGKDKCWFVNMPQGCKDANEILVKHGKEFLKNILKNPIPYPVEGLYRASDYSLQVQELYDGNYVKPLEIGIQGLDDILKILPSTFHTITGIPNHGKSLFLDQILLSIAENHNWKFAVFSPEHSTQMHIRRLVQMYKGKNFDENFENRMTKAELEEAMDFINKHFFFIETRNSVPDINTILGIAKSAILKHGIHGVIIDPYNEVDASRIGNKREDEHIRDFISLCKRFARVHEIVFWCVAHPTKLPKSTDGGYAPPTAYDISGASHWHNQSDVVMTVHRDFDDNSTRVITRKIREQDHYGKIGEVKFIYDFNTRRFVQHTVENW